MATASGALMECEEFMRTTNLRILRLLSISALTLLIGACGARTVVDEQGKPLTGVHVVATYRGEGFYFHGSNALCYRAEAIVTGADGKFDFPYFSGNFDPRTILKRWTEIGYFKAGYELVPTQADDADPVKMRPFSGISKQRFAPGFGDYSVFNPHKRCPDQERKLYPLLLAIHAEAKQIAKTFEERSQVIYFEYLMEEIPVDYADAATRYDEEVVKRIQKDHEKNRPAEARADEKRRQLKREMDLEK